MKEKKEITFFIGIILLQIKQILETTRIVDVSSWITDIILIIAYCFLVCTIFLKKEKLNITDIILIMLSILAYGYSKFTGMITFSLVLTSARGLNIKNIIKNIFKVNVIILLVHIALYIIYYIFGVDIMFNIRKGGIIRHTFLFGHANMFSSYLCWTYIMYLYLKYDRINIKDYLCMILLAVFIYYFPNSRTSSLILLVLMILIIASKYIKNNKIIDKILRQGILICSIFSIIMLIGYDDFEIVKKIDILFSTRIKLARASFECFGISLFGQYLPFSEDINLLQFGLTHLTLDSAYYSLMFTYGIILFLIVMYLMVRVSNSKKITLKDVIFIDIFALFALMETIVINPIFGFPLLFINNLYKQETEKSKEKNLTKKISVILPVYNSEKFLRKCIESVINQSYKNLEIIVINDGSKDNSLKILEEYEGKDNRIHIINKENTGVSDTRNVGIDVATGDYIAFVDGDDWIELEMLEKMLDNIERTGSDVLRCGYFRNYEDNTQKIIRNSCDDINERVLDKKYIKKHIIPKILSGEMPGYVPVLLIKRDILKEINHFDCRLAMREDTVFYIDLFLNIENLYIMDEPLYHYYYNENSASNSSQNYIRNFDNLILVNEIIKDKLIKKDLDNKKNQNIYNTTYARSIENTCFNIFKTQDKNLIREKYKYIIEKKETLDILKKAKKIKIPIHNLIAIKIMEKKNIESLIKYYSFRIKLTKIKSILTRRKES